MYLYLHSIISRMYHAKAPATGVGQFRFFYGLVTLQEVCFLLFFNHLIFDPIPYMDVEFPMIPFFLYLWGVIALFVTIGYRCQQAIIANYVFWVVFVNFTPMQRDFDGGFDLFMIGANLFMIFMPIDEAFSIDNLISKLKTPLKHYSLTSKQQVSVLSYTIPVTICLGFLYLDSGIHKLFAEHWRNGLGAWLPASMPYYISPLNFSWLLNNELLQKAMGYLILVFQFTFVFLYFKSSLRPLFFIIGAGIHLGITITLNIYPFGLGMLIFYALVVPFSWYKKMTQILTAETPSLTVFYDELCPLCGRTMLTINHFDIFSCIDFKGAQTFAAKYPALSEIEESILLTDLYAIDKNSKLYSGVDTYASILIKMRYLALLGYLLKLPGINQMAKTIYRRIADSRTRVSCDSDCIILENKNNQSSLYEQIFNPVSIKIEKRNIHRISKILIVLFLFQLNSTIHYGIVYRLNINIQSNQFTTLISSFSNTLILFSNTFLGITPHALYMHDHFEGYNHLIAITYLNDDGTESWLPLVSPDGRIENPNWGRVHSMWANIAVTPKINKQRLSKFIMKTTAFWGRKSGLELNNTKFIIKIKKISVPSTWEHNLLASNLSGSWEKIGLATWDNNSINIELPDNLSTL